MTDNTAPRPCPDAEWLRRLRTSAFMLLQNCEACSVNHYGSDYSGILPQWLVDCRRDLEQGFTRIADRRAEPELVGWQPIETAPVDEKCVFAYFGPNKQWHGFAAVVKQFQWECMDKPLPTGWPAHTAEPTHWVPLPNPPAAIEAASPEGDATLDRRAEPELTRQLHDLAVALHRRWYPEVTQWKPLEDAQGLLSQIDNMTTGAVRADTLDRRAEPELVERVVAIIRERARQRPSEGLIERQNISEDAIRYGQALLNALADQIAAIEALTASGAAPLKNMSQANAVSLPADEPPGENA